MSGITPRSPNPKVSLKGLGILGASLFVSACNDNGLGDIPARFVEGGDTPEKGTLVVPTASDGGARSVRLAPRSNRSEPSCPDVPRGYDPLSSATILAMGGESGQQVLGEIGQTDSCGQFDLDTIPEGATRIKAQADGYRDLEAEVTTFTDGDSDDSPVASTIGENASYQFSTFEVRNDGELAFNVVDDQTGRAVIGIPQDAFSLEVAGTPVDLRAISGSAAAQDPASTVLVLDASGSMGTTAYTDPDTSNAYTRLHLTRLAAHEFLDSKAEGDNVALLIFSSEVDFIEDDWIGTEWQLWNSQDGTQGSYTFSVDGFTSDSEDLRLPVDGYSPYSALYEDSRSGDPDPAVHPVTDATDLELQSLYQWGGGTAFHDAVVEAVSRLENEGEERRNVVAMTDGADNGSTKTLDEAINAANQADVTLHTVGLGDASNETDLQRMADETGGSYFGVKGTDLAGTFTNIQTGIRFQYRLEAAQQPASGSSVQLQLEYNGLQETATTTAP